MEALLTSRATTFSKVLRVVNSNSFPNKSTSEACLTGYYYLPDHIAMIEVTRASRKVGSSSPRNGDDVTGAYRAVPYPTWKVSENWNFSAAVEAYSYPYFFEDFATAKNGSTIQILHADVSYSRFWKNRSIVLRAGQLSSGFGSFLLRYDDAVNPLIDVPMSYGYYLRGVSIGSVACVGLDATLGRVDVRGQLTNSSPANPRSVLDTGQYLNWTAGEPGTFNLALLN